MSVRLVRLLAAGKSLVGLRDRAGQYQYNRKRGLPRFKKVENPFRATTLPHAGAAAIPVAEAAAASSAPTGAPASEGAGLRPLAAGQKRWWSKLLPFGRERTPPQPRLTAVLTQSELSLEKVKVVRNDLTDADFELVSRRSRVNAEREQTSAPKLPSTRGSGEQPADGPRWADRSVSAVVPGVDHSQ